MLNTKSVPPGLQTKKHFEILDGLRGVAALAVVIFHFMEIAIPEYKDNFIAHAYLAVDFFFCLSGFVVAYAYDQRLKTIGILNFFKLRLIRLHPLVMVGAILGLLGFMLDPFSNVYSAYSANTLGLFFSSFFMIPYPIVEERFFNLFHLNPPTWSLFWEYMANIFYALFLIKMRPKLLWTFTIVAAILLVYEAKTSVNLSVGWGGDNIMGGAIRVFYSFLAGVMVFRSKWIISSQLGFGVISLLLITVFLIPYTDETSWLVDSVAVLFIFPLLVALGAGGKLSPRLKGLCNFSGKISYPLYMVHYPLIWIFFSYVQKYQPGFAEMSVISIIGTIFFILLAYLVLIWIDQPIRNYLTQKLKKQWMLKK